MSAHHLKINPDKTELLFLPGKESPTHDLTTTFTSSVLAPPPTARNLGVTLDSQPDGQHHCDNAFLFGKSPQQHLPRSGHAERLPSSSSQRRRRRRGGARGRPPLRGNAKSTRRQFNRIGCPVPRIPAEASPLADHVSATRILCGALVFPTIATIVGKLMFSSVNSNLQRTILGGIAFVAIKGAFKVYFKQQQYQRQAHRKILNFPEQEEA
ncbi:uncharacterized protein LOC130198240 [Pseudoliparis swirei]|uniref:uncharacterized protein LOC130198240 n=1 Tax=Pseudoliparis swirei TaxID=2059687 RepID=UPI0024BEA28E|nr:uncharacterized protein LOC130198240 [Pseudoliparis swirei]